MYISYVYNVHVCSLISKNVNTTLNEKKNEQAGNEANVHIPIILIYVHDLMTTT